MKLGIFSLPNGNMTFRQAADYAVSVGLHAIEPYPAHEFATPDANALQAAKELARYAKEKGIAIPCFSLGIDVVSEKSRRQNIETLKRYADVASALGAPLLHHTLLPSLSHKAGTAPFADLLPIAAASVTEVFDYAASVGVRVVCEDQGFVFNGAERFERFLTTVDRDLGVVADLGNILYVNEDPTAFVGRFASQIVHVHMKDYLFKSGAAPWPGASWRQTRNGDYLRGTIVGHGVVDFVTVAKILQNVSYDGWFCLEFEGEEEAFSGIAQSVENFRRFYNQAAC